MDEYIKFKADEFGFYNGVDFSVYAVQVQNAIHVILIADNGKPKNPQNIGMLTGSAYCHEGDTFDFDYGVRLAVERAIKKDFPMIWRGFRRAQWNKLHDVTDEQMMITRWMPLSDHSRSTTLSPETIAGIQKMVSSIENAFKINGDSEGRKPVGFMHVDTPAGLTVSDGKVSLHEMTYHRIDTEDDDWISVDKELPGHDAEFMGRYSVCVEAKFADGHTEKNCWYDYSDGTWERSADVTMNIEYRRDIIAWRPMRGDK